MPHPHGRNRLSPDDLARLLASQLGSSKPSRPRFSLRDSVLIGRLIAGVIVLAMGSVIVGAVLLGVEWWTERSAAAEVLSSREVTAELASVPSGAPDPAEGADASSGGLAPVEAALTAQALAPWSRLPPPDTNPAAADGPTSTTTDRQSSPTSAGTPSTTASSATSLPSSTTLPPSSTKTTLVSTSTTSVVTSTTIARTTTTVPETTTSCAGKSGGNGGGNNCA